MATSRALPALSAEGNLSRYLARDPQVPDARAERGIHARQALAGAWRHRGRAQLVTSHLRLVAKIAMGYRGYGLPVSELISEGNVGMMQAVKRFDPDRGFRLATYAMWWIRASIQEYILH